MIKLRNKTQVQVIEMVCDLLEWYESNAKNASILQLLGFQDKLALLSVNLGQMTANSKGEYLRAYFQRKLTFSMKKLTFIDDGEKIGKAEEKATVQIGEAKKIEIDAHTEADSLQLTLRQVNKVLSAVQQRISFLKAEWDRMQNINQNNLQ